MHLQPAELQLPAAEIRKWWLSQFRRWGMVTGAPDYDGVAKQVMRADIYERR
jgi:nitrate/nitrite transport system substrate-binding protein